MMVQDRKAVDRKVVERRSAPDIAKIRNRVAEIRGSWSYEERLCRRLRAQICQERLLGVLLHDAA